MTQNTRPWPRPVARLSRHIIDKLTERMQWIKKPRNLLWVGLPVDKQACKEVAISVTGHCITTEQLEETRQQKGQKGSGRQYDGVGAHLIAANSQKVWTRLQMLARYVEPGSPVFISAITEIALQNEGQDKQLLCGQEALSNVEEIGKACGALGFTGIVLERATVHCAFPDRDACLEDMEALLTGLFDGDTRHAEVLRERIMEQSGRQSSSPLKHLVRVEVILGCMFTAKESARDEGEAIEVPVTEIKMRSPQSD